MILNVIVTESLIRGKKLNIYFVFITQSYFVVPKNIRLNALFYYEISKKKKNFTLHFINNQILHNWSLKGL